MGLCTPGAVNILSLASSPPQVGTCQHFKGIIIIKVQTRTTTNEPLMRPDFDLTWLAMEEIFVFQPSLSFNEVVWNCSITWGVYI